MSFKDAFTKDGAGGNPLNYDDSAFAYFASTCLTCVLIPWAYIYVENRLHIFSETWRVTTAACAHLAWHVRKYYRQTIGVPKRGVGEETSALAGDKADASTRSELLECACSLCVQKKRALLAEQPIWQRFFGTPADCLQLLGLVLLTGILVYIGTNYLSMMPNVATFNPWTILNITEATGEREIRKAFRTMSLKYHPDKNPNDASAAAKFLLISKAFHTLTDEAARRNFEKYGNPDGRTGMMKVGIGLPTFMIHEDFQIFILTVFFITLLVIVPGCFLLYYNHINQYAPNGLKKDTVHLLGGTMNSKIGAHRVIALIAASSEIRDLRLTATQEEIELLSRKCQGKEVDKICTLSKDVLKVCLLLYVHLARQTYTLPQKLQAETRAILRQAIRVSRAMLDIAFINNWIPAIQIILAVRKCLLQSVEIGSMPVTQIPHVLTHEYPKGAEAADALKLPQQSLERSKQLLDSVQKFKPADFHDLVKVALENKCTAFKGFTDAELADIECVYKTIPKIKFDGKVFVDDEEEICIGDVATCRLTFTREHLAVGQKQGAVHSPFYPDMRGEEWFVFISDSNNELHGYKNFTDNAREVVVDIQFPIMKLGEWKMTAVVLSEAYFGVDRTVDFSFNVIHPQASSRKEFVHPDDVALDGQASFVQQFLGTAALGEDEEEDDDEDAENTGGADGTDGAPRDEQEKPGSAAPSGLDETVSAQ